MTITAQSSWSETVHLFLAENLECLTLGTRAEVPTVLTGVFHQSPEKIFRGNTYYREVRNLQ